MNQIDSPLETLKMKLVSEFRQALENKLPLTKQSDSYNNFFALLAQKGITIQDFIQFNKDSKTLILEMFLGFEKLLTNISQSQDEKKQLLSILTIGELLHEDFNLWIIKKFNKAIKDNIEDENSLKCLQEAILFYAQYLKSGIFDIAGFERIKLSFKSNDLELYYVISNILKQRLLMKDQHPFFEKFIVNKDGKKVFLEKTEDKIIKYFLSKKANNDELDEEIGEDIDDKPADEPLYFKGPNTLKYIGYLIPLDNNDASHISRKEKSIMSAATFGPESREWDALTTAIMLDLGYNVDNYWTRLWGHGKSEEKSATKESRDPLPKKKEKNRAKQNSKIKDTKSAKKKRTTETKAKKTASKEKKAKGSKAIKSAKKKRTAETKAKKKASRAKKAKGNKAVKAA